MAYATQADLLNVGFPSSALGTLTTPQVTAALENASEYADGYFRARWGSDSVPLVEWDSAVTDAVCKIAALRLLRVRGYNPQSSADQRFLEGAREAEAWLDKVQRQQAHPLVKLKSEGSPGGADPQPREPKLYSTSVVDLASGARGQNRGW